MGDLTLPIRASLAERRRIDRGLIDPNPGVARLVAPHPGSAAMASPPTITVGTTNAASVISGSARIAPAVTTAFRYYGGPARVNAANYPYDFVDILGLSGVPSGHYSLDFMFDGDQFELSFWGTSPRWQLWVDGVPNSLSANTSIPSDGNHYKVLVAFGSRANRHIRVVGSGMRFGGIYKHPTATIWRSHRPIGPRVIVMGDSFTEGTGTETWMGFANQMGLALGWLDTRNSGSGGTGYLNPGPGGRVKFRDRLQAGVIDYAPDIFIMAGGINDQGFYTSAAIGAEAGLIFDAIRLQLPKTHIIALGPFWPHGTPVATIPPMRDAIRTEALRVGATFIDNIGGPVPYSGTIGDYTGKGWMTGTTGKVGSTNGLGNDDYYTGGDNTHPSPAGHVYLGMRLASAIAEAMPL